MKIRYPIITLWMTSLFVTISAFAIGPPDSLWSQTFGEPGQDICYSVQQTSDGGYILVGSTRSFGAGDNDFWLVKTDASGDSLWSCILGGDSNDVCYSGQQTHDGSYVLAGYTCSFGAGDADVWLVKTDANCDSLCSRTFGGSFSDICNSVRQTSDSGYILAGSTTSFSMGPLHDFWLVKTNANCDCLWSHPYGGTHYEEALAVQQTTDSGYIVAGWTSSYGVDGRDFYLVKTDGLGDTLWTHTYGDSGSDCAAAVQQTADGGYIVAGHTTSFGPGDWDFYLVKTNSTGDTLWTRTYGDGDGDFAYAIRQTADGGYIVGGYTNSFGSGGADFWLLKVNADGDSLWSRTFGGYGRDECYSVQQTLDGGYALAGLANSFGAGEEDFWLVKTVPESPYHVTVYQLWFGDREPTVRWIAPFFCDYLIYSTTNPNHDGNPPGPDWTLDATVNNVPAGPAFWIDPNPIVPYKNYIVVASCP